MFWHVFKYEFLFTLRNRSILLWLILFPIILGTFFNLAFGDLYERSEVFEAIPVAVVMQADNEQFQAVLDSVSEGDDALLGVTEMSEEDALKNLKDEKVSGIIYVGASIELTVTKSGIDQTVIKSFLDQYKSKVETVIQIMSTNPENLDAATKAMADEVKVSTATDDAKTNNFYVLYFYNLISMVCLYCSMIGKSVAMHNQANLSEIAARKNVAPTSKLVLISSGLFSSVVISTICVYISMLYLIFVLGADFGSRLPFVFLTAFLGSCVGVSLGLFVGSLGNGSDKIKTSILMTISMVCCLFSGLFVGNMRAIVALICPIINYINPAALISDSFYALLVYDTYDRYIMNCVIMLSMTALFTILGVLATRRKKYASI